MTDRELNALFGLLALRENFVTQEHLLGALGLSAASGEPDLGKFLVTQRVMRAGQARAVEALVGAYLETHGSARRAIDALAPPARLRAKLLAGEEEAPSSVRRSRDTARRVRRPKPPPAAPGERFVLGPEIGRGGLARVLEAADREIGRTVALKIVFADEPEEVLERFRWEARITGRLEHPNIVPVHEMGELPASKSLYFAMKKISGSDLHGAIHGGGWKLRRLVEAFRDVCRAVAFAHSRGVIHRDLKPANVMVGDFGEVLVVDWGLARLIGEPEAPGDRRVRARPRTDPGEAVAERAESSHLTLEGDVLGTPAYMPPEQATGRLAELDERSDVYSLGAILYEILTRRPPHRGETSFEVLAAVIGRPVRPPSEIAEVPEELEAICLRALSKNKEDRPQRAADLQADVEAWLEGTRERERREGIAREQVALARGHVRRWRDLGSEAREARAKAEAEQRTVRPYDPPEARRTLWAAEDRAAALEREGAEAFSEAEAQLTSALSNVPGHAEARQLKAEMAWTLFLDAERAGDPQRMILHRRAAGDFDDGSLAAAIRGDGTLEVRTRAWPCRCLEEPREVAPGDLNVLGFHPWSGRRLSGPGAAAPGPAEPAAPLRLRVHAPACAPTALDGARAWVYRFEEENRLSIPVTHSRAGVECPAALLDAAFGNSPFRPRGGGHFLGRTPLPPRPWPMGSWLLVLEAPGRVPARVPFAVGRQQAVALDVTLHAPGEIPAGLLPVAAGPFPFQGDPVNPNAEPLEILALDDFFLARLPVTCREYAEFLTDVLARDPAEARKRAPRDSNKAEPWWPPGYAVPTAAWLATAPPEARAKALRLRQTGVDWEEAWPVIGVSALDAHAYAAWRSAREGRLLCLPHDAWWEKAARGPDGRPYPWGRTLDECRSNTSGSHASGSRPEPVTSFPDDESPYGVRGLAGNSADWCLNDPGDPHFGRPVIRGGNWAQGRGPARSTFRYASTGGEPWFSSGIRLAAPARLSADPRPLH